MIPDPDPDKVRLVVAPEYGHARRWLADHGIRHTKVTIVARANDCELIRGMSFRPEEIAWLGDPPDTANVLRYVQSRIRPQDYT